MLKHSTEIRVRFNDADPLGIVWHGNYIQYFEDAREAFGDKYGFTYLNIHASEYVVPIVNVNCDYKQPLKYGDTAVVEVEFVNTAAAKIIFNYRIYKKGSDALIAAGQSTQVFLNRKSEELEIVNPSFYLEWKKKWNVL